MKISQFAGYIWQVEETVGPNIPLHIHLVKGPEYAVLIDSGLKSSFEAVKALLEAAQVEPAQVKVLFNTHAHHDHMGANAQVKALTGCLIAAHPGSISWIEDHEINFQEFCCAFPKIFPDTPELRQEIATTMDEPATRVDWRVGDGVVLNLGNGIILETLEVPGHMPAELAFYERNSATLIIGDSITLTDAPFFHGHLDVPAYRRTISRLREMRRKGLIKLALPAHYPPHDGLAFDALLDRVEVYLNNLDSEILQILQETNNSLSHEQIWRELCRRFDKQLEWRGLSMTEAHLRSLKAAGHIREVGTDKFGLNRKS